MANGVSHVSSFARSHDTTQGKSSGDYADDSHVPLSCICELASGTPVIHEIHDSFQLCGGYENLFSSVFSSAGKPIREYSLLVILQKSDFVVILERCGNLDQNYSASPIRGVSEYVYSTCKSTY